MSGMPATSVYLVRHGQVDNPGGVLYGRLPGFGLTDRGKRMAAATAQALAAQKLPVTRIVASPLQRAQESAAPISAAFGLPVHTDKRLIETGNHFEGRPLAEVRTPWRHPENWRYLLRPGVPSWGEPYTEISERMLAAMHDAAREAPGGAVILVSHELPIWMVHRRLAGQPLRHNPALRRCALSSVTGFAYDPQTDRFLERSYTDPARAVREAPEVSAD